MILAFRRFLCDDVYPTMLIGFVNKIGQLFCHKQKTSSQLGKRLNASVKRTLNAIGKMNARPSPASVLPLDMQALLAKALLAGTRLQRFHRKRFETSGAAPDAMTALV